MLRLTWRRELKVSFRATKPSRRKKHNSTVTPKQHDPLKVLFCGADEFSIYSLRALRELQAARPDKIASIDVICRPDKRVGRGLKQTREVPIKGVASELGLSLHQIDSFKDWPSPAYVNLVIAVSFGLLVPARILAGAKYGGLNVHPSLLPDLRGPAPMIHTLLKRRSHTGVTLQTMHPTRFDYGKILAQTPPSGVPVPPECTPDELLKTLGPLGADILYYGIEDGIFVPPLMNMMCYDFEEGLIVPPRSDTQDTVPKPQPLDHSPKITSEDRRINWTTWTADEILLRDRVLGRLWDSETYSRSLSNRAPKRTTFHGPWFIQNDVSCPTPAGEPSVIITGKRTKDLNLAIRTVDSKLVIPTSATIEGEGKGHGLMSLIQGLSGA